MCIESPKVKRFITKHFNGHRTNIRAMQHFSDEGEWRSVRTDGYRTQISQLNDQGVMSTSLVIENVKQSDITGELYINVINILIAYEVLSTKIVKLSIVTLPNLQLAQPNLLLDCSK